MSYARNERRRVGRGRERHAHKMVAETAQKMAREVWDQIMTRRGDIYDKFCAQHPELETVAAREEFFVGKLWPTMLDEARATLARMLAAPHIDELQKQLIYDALRLDNTLIKGKVRNIPMTQTRH